MAIGSLDPAGLARDKNCSFPPARPSGSQPDHDRTPAENLFYMRAAWIEKTGYQERSAKKHTGSGGKETGQAVLVRDKQDTEAASRLDRIRGDFLKKCEAGDPFSLMLKARQDGDLIEYWSQFSRYEIEEAKARGKKSSRTVTECQFMIRFSLRRWL